jgi:hypothetical protein
MARKKKKGQKPARGKPPEPITIVSGGSDDYGETVVYEEPAEVPTPATPAPATAGIEPQRLVR